MTVRSSRRQNVVLALSVNTVPSLRFKNPVDLPCYGGYDFRVEPSIITLRAKDIRDVYARYLKDHQKYYSRIPKHWPRYQEAIDVAAMHRDLTEACKLGLDIESESSDYLYAFACELMFDRRFVGVECPQCERSFSPKECSVKKWEIGEDLFASGGRRVICPRGHTLYACAEWNS